VRILRAREKIETETETETETEREREREGGEGGRKGQAEEAVEARVVAARVYVQVDRYRSPR